MFSSQRVHFEEARGVSRGTVARGVLGSLVAADEADGAAVTTVLTTVRVGSDEPQAELSSARLTSPALVHFNACFMSRSSAPIVEAGDGALQRSTRRVAEDWVDARRCSRHGAA
jgi:hypothetical protein